MFAFFGRMIATSITLFPTKFIVEINFKGKTS